MLGQLPVGVVEGRLVRRARDALATERERLWGRLVVQYRMPKKEYVFVHELRELYRGTRWAPIYDPQIWAEARAMCCPDRVNLDDPALDPDQMARAIRTSKVLDSRIQFYKLSWFLHHSGMPPLIKVRRERYHSLVYIIYCCMIADPGNVTLWRVGPVHIPMVAPVRDAEIYGIQGYLHGMYRRKREMWDRLRELQLDISIENMYNQVFHIVENSLILNKGALMAHRYPNSPREYELLTQVDRDNLEFALENLRDNCFNEHQNIELVAPNHDDYDATFDSRAWFAICFDPLFSAYDEEDFEETPGAAEIWEAYQAYRAAVRVLNRAHEDELDLAWDESIRRRPRNQRRRLRGAGVRDNGPRDDDGGSGSGKQFIISEDSDRPDDSDDDGGHEGMNIEGRGNNRRGRGRDGDDRGGRGGGAGYDRRDDRDDRGGGDDDGRRQNPRPQGGNQGGARDRRPAWRYNIGNPSPPGRMGALARRAREGRQRNRFRVQVARAFAEDELRHGIFMVTKNKIQGSYSDENSSLFKT